MPPSRFFRLTTPTIDTSTTKFVHGQLEIIPIDDTQPHTYTNSRWYTQPMSASNIMLRILLNKCFLILVINVSALLSGCRAQLQQSIRFNATMTLSPVTATAADFGSNTSVIATFEALTWETFEAGIMDSPNENPLFLVPPEITSLRVVEAKDIAEGVVLGITFETVMNVISEVDLSEENLLLDIKFSSYWYGDTARLLAYVSGLATKAPTVFGTVGNMAIDFDQAETVDAPTTNLPVPSPSAPFVSQPTNPSSVPILSPSITLTLP